MNVVNNYLIVMQIKKGIWLLMKMNLGNFVLNFARRWRAMQREMRNLIIQVVELYKLQLLRYFV